jgi:redox-sensitive bicupin YhaK (pirin superfamily)
MIQHIKSSERYHADHGWLSTWHHFSFNDYFDPNNVSFGALRVFTCSFGLTIPAVLDSLRKS